MAGSFLKKNSYIVFFLFFPLVISIATLNTAEDRSAYFHHFSRPFGDGRIEPLFQYYMAFFDLLYIKPEVSVVFTCVLIYFFLCLGWLKIAGDKSFFSFLFFNAVAWSVMNYYTISSLRMGLAISVSIYIISEYRSFFKKSFYLIFPVFLHYGILLFFLSVCVICAFSFFSRKKYFLGVLFFLLISMLVFERILAIGFLSDYHLQFFVDSSLLVARVFPFTIIFSCVVLLLQLLNFPRVVLGEFFDRIAMFSVCFILFFFYTGNPMFGKMMMPVLFVQCIWLYSFLKQVVEGLEISRALVYAFLIFGNVISILYGLGV